MSRPAAVIVGCHWLENRSELAFVTRSIAGAASRSGPVTVLVPGDQGLRADGAYDLEGVGPLGALEWPAGLTTETTVIVDDLPRTEASMRVRKHELRSQGVTSTTWDRTPSS